MSNLGFTHKEFNLSEEVSIDHISYTLDRPFVRIVQDKNGKKIPKVILFLRKYTLIEAVHISTNEADYGETENPSSKEPNIHCNVTILINDEDNETQEQENYKIVEVNLDKNNSEIITHFQDNNSFLSVACESIDETKGVLGTMTIASYQNGGTVDEPPMHGDS